MVTKQNCPHYIPSIVWTQKHSKHHTFFSEYLLCSFWKEDHELTPTIPNLQSQYWVLPKIKSEKRNFNIASNHTKKLPNWQSKQLRDFYQIILISMHTVAPQLVFPAGFLSDTLIWFINIPLFIRLYPYSHMLKPLRTPRRKCAAGKLPG